MIYNDRDEYQRAPVQKQIQPLERTNVNVTNLKELLETFGECEIYKVTDKKICAFFVNENKRVTIYREDFIQSFFELENFKKKHKKYIPPVLPPEMVGMNDPNKDMNKKIGKFHLTISPEPIHQSLYSY